MDERVLKPLCDILTSVERVEGFFSAERPKMYADFCKDIMLRQAVERNIEIMGEAMNRILKITPDIQITNARKIVDARNYVIHAYDSLSTDILWSIVINHLPQLHKEIETLLNNN